MELWVVVTIIAATAQTIRTAIQRQMKGALGDYGASAIRFIYAVPFSLIWLLCILWYFDHSLPQLTFPFFLWLAVGGLSQIIFTVFLVKLFSYKNFVVGVAFSKTEVLLVAILEALILSIAINLQFAIAIVIGTISVIMLSLKENLLSFREIRTGLQSRSTGIGLLAGVALALSVVGFRAAIDALASDELMVRAATAGALGVIGQAFVMVGYLFMFRKQELIASLSEWKPGVLTGVFATTATGGWFIAFAMHSGAAVRAVGQIELVLSIAITILAFKQKITKIELTGVILLLASILLVVLN